VGCGFFVAHIFVIAKNLLIAFVRMKILWQSPEDIGAVDICTLLSICLPAGRQVAAIRCKPVPIFSGSGAEAMHKASPCFPFLSGSRGAKNYF
jgi:hypothetical protein